MSDAEEDTYVESQVIMTTVQAVTPFALTYGLFMTFHGADTPGGSFQGGAIIGATIIMIAFAFGIEPTRDWFDNRIVVALASGGVIVFTLVGLIPIALGDRFLGYDVYEQTFGIDIKWGLEAIEIGGVALIVAGVIVGLFFVIADGFYETELGRELQADGGEPQSERTGTDAAATAAETDGGDNR